MSRRTGSPVCFSQHPVQEKIVHDEVKIDPDYISDELNDFIIKDLDDEWSDLVSERYRRSCSRNYNIAAKLELWQEYEEDILYNIEKQKKELWNTLSLRSLSQHYKSHGQGFNEYEEKLASKRSHMTPQEKYLIERTQICQNQLLTEIERSANRGR